MENDNRESLNLNMDETGSGENTEAAVLRKRKSSAGSLFFSGVIVGLALALLVGSVAYLCVRLQSYTKQKDSGLTGENPFLDSGELTFRADSAISPGMIAKLQTLEKVIDKYYYPEEVEKEVLAEGVYRGLIYSLGDPYSEYFSAEELEEMLNRTEGIYYGIGAYVSMDPEAGLPKITSVMPGSPAEAAQILADDMIYAVDDELVYGMTLTEATDLMKGPEGTQVMLTVIRQGEADYLKIPVTREKVETPTVAFRMLDETTAYIQIFEFDEVTVDQFAEALAVCRESGMKGMILDLRDNPGGSMSSVVDIARMMLPEGLIVYTEDKEGKRVEYSCDGSRKMKEKLVVLVNGYSASAAEILAGGIQDYGIGTLVGTTTYGKGVVQQLVPLMDGSAVKITKSAYFTPDGRNIHEVGIEPDIVCAFDVEAYLDSENPVDNQLEKAKEVLESIN